MSRRSEALRAKKAQRDAEENSAAAAAAGQKKPASQAMSKRASVASKSRSRSTAATTKTTTLAKQGSTSSKNQRSKNKKVENDTAPKVVVSAITDSDVLLGRGSGIARHTGNVFFRQLVNNARNQYHKTERNKKMYVAAAIIQKILAQKPPGRFLEHASKHPTSSSNPKYYLVEYKRALEKSCQALREKQPTIGVPTTAESTSPTIVATKKQTEPKRSAPPSGKPKAPVAKRRKVSLRGPSLDEAAAKFKPATVPLLPDRRDPSPPPPPLIVTTSVENSTSSADDSSLARRMKGLTDQELAAIVDLTSLARSVSPSDNAPRTVSTTPTTGGRYLESNDIREC